MLPGRWLLVDLFLQFSGSVIQILGLRTSQEAARSLYYSVEVVMLKTKFGRRAQLLSWPRALSAPERPNRLG